MTRAQVYIIGIQNKLNRHGFKLSDLVRESGISAGSFTHWKSGRNKIRQSSVDKINKAVLTLIKEPTE